MALDAVNMSLCMYFYVVNTSMCMYLYAVNMFMRMALYAVHMSLYRRFTTTLNLLLHKHHSRTCSRKLWCAGAQGYHHHERGFGAGGEAGSHMYENTFCSERTHSIVREHRWRSR